MEFLSNYQIGNPKPVSQAMLGAGQAALRDQIEFDLPRSENFLTVVQELNGTNDLQANATRVKRMFSDSFRDLHESIQIGKDIGVFGFETSSALDDMAVDLRNDARQAVSKAYENIREGVELSTEQLPAFAASAKQQLAWVRRMAGDLLEGQKIDIREPGLN
jgi:hypothetical protein